MKYYSSIIALLSVYTLVALERDGLVNKLSKEVADKVIYKPQPKQRTTFAPLPVRIVWHNRASYYARFKAKPATDNPYTTSVIIPCYYKHARLLYELLRSYEHQTQLPDEVVISLSQADLVPDAVIQQLCNERWAFPVKLVTTNKQQYAGENRNNACDHASGTIFICQDADDLPHPQRVEIIKHFFQHYPVDHLFHQWQEVVQGVPASFQHYDDLEQISFAYHRSFRELWRYAKFTNGNVAIARHVFDKIRWSSEPRGQDTTYNTEVYKQFEHGIAIQATLLGYRRYLSSANTIDSIKEEQEVIIEENKARPKLYLLQIIAIEAE